MSSPRPGEEETILREYPRSTRWLEGRRILGVGNLILTNRRLLFIHAIDPTPEQAENIRKMADASTDKAIRFALGLDKRNFQVSLTAITAARTGVFTWFPFPGFCLKVRYLEGRKQVPREASFQFTIPLLQGFFRLELTTVYGWALSVRRAARRAGRS